MESSPFDPDELIEHSDALRRMARGLIGESVSAEDVVQSTFLTALEHPPKAPRSLRAWLRRVLSSRATDVLRGRSRRNELERSLANERSLSSDDIDRRFELTEEVVKAVRELGESYRKVIYLRYFENLPPREIAERLELPLATVKTQLARALEKLRDRLSRTGDGDRREWALLLAPLTRLAPSTSAATLSMGWGVTIMWKKLALITTGVLALFAAWHFSGNSALPPGEEGGDLPVLGESVLVQPPSDTVEEPQPFADRRALAEEAMPALGAAPTRGVLVLRALWSDGSPAAGLGIRLTPAADPIVGRSIRAIVTDAEGMARVEDLEAGRVLLESDRMKSDHSGSATADVVAGEERTVVFRQEAGVAVQGVVVDEHGQPVAGAGIWLANWHNDWRGGSVVATSDTDGRFHLRDVKAEQSLGAISAGHGPSKLVDLDLVESSEPPLQVRLELSGAGAALKGRVLDPQGEPVSGAQVAVGRSPRRLQSRLDGGFVEKWTSRIASTDASGSFEFRGLTPGLQPLRVLAAGFAEWGTELELAPGREDFAEVRLQRGVRVRGVVRDEFGDTVEGAVVMVLDDPLEDHVPTRGAIEAGRTFLWPAVRSGVDGAFELPPAPAGVLHLYASKGAHFWRGSSFWNREKTAFAGVSQETLRAVAEGELVWDPVLTIGASIRGRVTFADGEPMIWASVTASDEKTGQRFTDQSTDKDGSFFIPGLDHVAYTLSVHYSDAPLEAEPVRQSGVWPGDSPLELVAGWSRVAEQLGSVEGRLLDSAGRLSSASPPYILLEAEGPTWSANAEIEGDRFHFEHIAPGRYRVRVLSEDDPVQTWEWFDIAPGEARDLGTLETEPGGTLHVHFDRSEETRNMEFTLYVRGPGFSGPNLYFPAKRQIEAGASLVTIEGLPPGDYQARVAGEGLVYRPTRMRIEANEELEVTKKVEVGVRFAFELLDPGRHEWGELTIVVRQNGVPFDERAYSAKSLVLPHTTEFTLPVGNFEITATTDTGLSARRSFEVESLAEPESPIRLELSRQ